LTVKEKFMSLFGNKSAPEPPVTEPPVVEPAFDVKAAFTGLDQRLAQLAGIVEQVATRPVQVNAAPPPLVPEPPEISDAELEALIADGKGGPQIKALLEQKINKATSQMRGELNTFRQYGTTMLASLAERASTTGMDPDLAKRFGPEIKALVEMCDAELRGHPDTWQTAYHTVIGRHQPELAAEMREQAIRQHTDETARAATLPGRGARPQPNADADEVPTLQEVLGVEAAAKFNMTDLSEDEFIRRMNRGKPARERYKDWSDYCARGVATDEKLRALREGLDDGGEGDLPRSLQ
jgi:hypothetical protein